MEKYLCVEEFKYKEVQIEFYNSNMKLKSICGKQCSLLNRDGEKLSDDADDEEAYLIEFVEKYA